MQEDEGREHWEGQARGDRQRPRLARARSSSDMPDDQLDRFAIAS
ncbi:hypothetical protein ACQ4N7_05440 [Nodosilinea sp. AN01ver1]